MEQPVIQMTKVAKSFGNNQVLIDLDLSICKGIIYSLLGKNGVGKSTTIRLLLMAKKHYLSTKQLLPKFSGHWIHLVANGQR